MKNPDKMSQRELRLEVIENRRMIQWLNNELENQREELDRVKRAFAIYLRPDECACDKGESE